MEKALQPVNTADIAPDLLHGAADLIHYGKLAASQPSQDNLDESLVAAEECCEQKKNVLSSETTEWKDLENEHIEVLRLINVIQEEEADNSMLEESVANLTIAFEGEDDDIRRVEQEVASAMGECQDLDDEFNVVNDNLKSCTEEYERGVDEVNELETPVELKNERVMELKEKIEKAKEEKYELEEKIEELKSKTNDKKIESLANKGEKKGNNMFVEVAEYAENVYKTQAEMRENRRVLENICAELQKQVEIKSRSAKPKNAVSDEIFAVYDQCVQLQQHTSGREDAERIRSDFNEALSYKDLSLCMAVLEHFQKLYTVYRIEFGALERVCKSTIERMTERTRGKVSHVQKNPVQKLEGIRAVVSKRVR
ncbi:unnamed protein product [Bursaphelenchus okinawaensis]|uniref:Uncharacterized protein n=1 Tax=Bursaphelenchus okinawaensis TaxID=465554 RepID=A0A811K511_9BILA|nr:unnamed protein product [Bursaphelenchus okinawaensis]CAG9091482.1 unnamed protein product [Bursaphelenchus okinawaensis]